MPESSQPLLLGEYSRRLDDRFRLSIPPELAERLDASRPCVLAKQQPGAVSLWSAATWRQRLERQLPVLQSKWQAGRLDERLTDVQRLGRLLSSRHREVQLAGRGRLVLPEGFREFLGVEPGGEVMIVGAAVCVEIWSPSAWVEYLRRDIPEFNQLLDSLIR